MARDQGFFVRKSGQIIEKGWDVLGMSLASFIVNPAPGEVPRRWESEGFSGKPWVEIGFGNGEFLVHLAGEHPERLIVGVEMSLTSVLKTARRAQREGRSNVRLLHGDARFVVHEAFADGTVDRIYMNFPCPWPKQRHARRRVTAEGFASRIAAVLSLGGEFLLTTDEGWYAEEVRHILSQHPALEVLSFVVNPPHAVTTKYERKWLASGKDIFTVVFCKVSPWTERRLVKGSMEMHVEIPFRDNLKNRLPHLVGGEGKEEGVWWRFLEGFWGDDGVALVPVLANDEGFEQRFLLRLVPRPATLLVKVDPVGSPYRTPAVAATLRAAARIIAGPDDETALHETDGDAVSDQEGDA